MKKPCMLEAIVVVGNGIGSGVRLSGTFRLEISRKDDASTQNEDNYSSSLISSVEKKISLIYY